MAAGSTLESAPTNIEDDLNSLRSQFKRAIWADSAGNWYDDLQTANSKKRGQAALNSDLDDIEEKRLLFRSQMMTDVTVTASQNYEVLVQASSETPTQAAAVGSGTYEGAVVAVLSGDVGSHDLAEVAGPDAISPKNLCLVRDAATGDPIQSSSREVYALLQAESGTADGDAFNDSDKQAQLSFVRINATGDDLEACPVADIEGKTINYSYVRRVAFDNIPETAFLTGTFLDQVPTGVSVTLDTAIDNQTGPATQTDRNIDWRITDTYTFKFQTSDGGVDLFSVAPTSGGDTIAMNVDTLDINNVNDADFSGGAKFDTGGTTINVGVTAGQVDSAGALTLASAAAGDLKLDSAGDVLFDDGSRGGSTYSVDLKLAADSAEWSAFDTAFGEVSLLAAIVQAAKKENRTKAVARVTTTINEDTDLVSPTNIDAALPAYDHVSSFVTDVDVYVNGQLMRNGADAAANHDVYPGTTPASGYIKFEFKLKVDDQVTMIVWGEA